ncbi:hypothetical protein PAAL109150_17340 [Paenibacillus alkaliterrae]
MTAVKVTLITKDEISRNASADFFLKTMKHDICISLNKSVIVIIYV